METRIDDQKIKDFFKQALFVFETLKEKRGVFPELMVEVMEDIGMVRAIQEGENSGSVAREEIFQLLEGEEGAA